MKKYVKFFLNKFHFMKKICVFFFKYKNYCFELYIFKLRCNFQNNFYFNLKTNFIYEKKCVFNTPLDPFGFFDLIYYHQYILNISNNKL